MIGCWHAPTICSGTARQRRFSKAPDVTRSMHSVVDDLRLDSLFVVCPSPESYPVHERISVQSLLDLSHLPGRIDAALR